jgi:hypothetical protein
MDDFQRLAGQLGAHLGFRLGEKLKREAAEREAAGPDPERVKREAEHHALLAAISGPGIDLLRVDRSKPDLVCEAFKSKP